MTSKNLILLSLGLLLLMAGMVTFAQVLPDSDGDGFPDGEDACPQQAGPPTSTNGCPPQQQQAQPDQDGDTVPDATDECLETPGLVANNGCPPDSDGDGFHDPFDDCPQQPAPNSENGCPPQQATEEAAPPQPGADRDGDTVPDTEDLCPDDAGIPEWNGCPDADGDGLTTQYDDCPDQFGPRENGGCPVDDAPTATPTPAPANNNQPTATSVPQSNNPPPANNAEEAPPATTGAILASSEQDMSVTLGACPDILEDATVLPIFVQMDIIHGGHADPCTHAQTILGNLVFGGAGPALSQANADAILQNCPTVMPALVAMMDTLQGLNPGAWAALDGVMTPDNACALAESIAQQILPPEFIAALGGLGRPAPMRDFIGPLPFPVAQTASVAVIDAAIAMCLPTPSPERAATIRTAILNQNISEAEVLAAPCTYVAAFQFGANFTPVQQEFISMMVNRCGASLPEVVLTMRELMLMETSLQRMLSLLTIDELCNPPFVTPENLTLLQADPRIRSLLPASAADCIEGFASGLQTLSNELTLSQLFVILNSPNPCQTVRQYLQTETLPWVAGPSCFSPAGDTITLADGTTITAATDWLVALTVLTRPADDASFCAALPAPPPLADTDGDGVLDSEDACPTDFFVYTTNGCTFGTGPVAPPAGADPPLPGGSPDAAAEPVAPDGGVSPVGPVPLPDQNIALGEIINVGVPATTDTLPLIYTVNSDNPAIAAVTNTGPLLTIVGVAQGQAVITVTISDGVNAPISTAFMVTVFIPASGNNPPTIQALPAQETTTGSPVNINVVTSDPEGDLVLLNATISDNLVGTVSLAGDVLTVTGGVNPGTAIVTVIASDGTATSTTTFNVNNTIPMGVGPGGEQPATEAAAAPPAQAASTANQPPAGNAGNPNAQPTTTNPSAINRQTTRASLANAGVSQEQLSFGLLQAFGDGSTVSAVFQASSPDGTVSSLYMLKDSQPVALIEGSADERLLYPTLAPNTLLVLFIAQDAAGNRSLRVFNIENSASLTLFSDDANLTVADSPPVWSPDGAAVLVTLINADGIPGLYRVSVATPSNIPPPELVFPEAQAGVYAPNGRHLAFVQAGTNGTRNIHVMQVGLPTTAQAITQQPTDQHCEAPTFGADSLTLFFACANGDGTQSIYRYDISGLEAINTTVTGPQNPAPGPGQGFMGFDDGAVIYYGGDAGGNFAPLLRLENLNVSNIRW